MRACALLTLYVLVGCAESGDVTAQPGPDAGCVDCGGDTAPGLDADFADVPTLADSGGTTETDVDRSPDVPQLHRDTAQPVGDDAPEPPDTAAPVDADGPPDAALDVTPEDGGAPADTEIPDLTDPVADAVELDVTPDDAEAPPDAEAPETAEPVADVTLVDVEEPLDDAGPPDATTPEDSGPVDTDTGPEPVTPSEGAPTVASAQLLGTVVVHATPVGGALAAVGEAGVTWLGSGPPAVLDTSLTSVVAGAALDATRVFLSESAASFVAQAGSFTPSPIVSAMGGDVSGVAVRAGTSPTIWLAAQGKLWRWRDAQVKPLVTPGYDFSEARLALDDGVLWAAAPFGLYRIVEAAGGADVLAVRPDLDATDVAVDSGGRIATLDTAGNFHLRDASGVWAAWRFPAPATVVCGSWVAGQLFVVLADGALWFVAPDGRWPVAAAGSGILGCAVDALGRGVTWGEAGLTRWAVNAPVDVGPTEVTWAGQIGPLLSARCSMCHGPNGYAHSLYTFEQAKNEIDALLLMVSSGAMPLPPNVPLSGAEVGLIQAWKTGGFLE